MKRQAPSYYPIKRLHRTPLTSQKLDLIFKNIHRLNNHHRKPRSGSIRVSPSLHQTPPPHPHLLPLTLSPKPSSPILKPTKTALSATNNRHPHQPETPTTPSPGGSKITNTNDTWSGTKTYRGWDPLMRDRDTEQLAHRERGGHVCV